MKKTVIALSSITAVMLATAAFAAPAAKPEKPVPAPKPEKPRFEQRKGGHKIPEFAPEEVKAQYKALFSINHDLKLELNKDNPDAAKAIEMVKKAEELHLKIREWKVSQILEGKLPKPDLAPKHEPKEPAPKEPAPVGPKAEDKKGPAPRAERGPRDERAPFPARGGRGYGPRCCACGAPVPPPFEPNAMRAPFPACDGERPAPCPRAGGPKFGPECAPKPEFGRPCPAAPKPEMKPEMREGPQGPKAPVPAPKADGQKGPMPAPKAEKPMAPAPKTPENPNEGIMTLEELGERPVK